MAKFRAKARGHQRLGLGLGPDARRLSELNPGHYRQRKSCGGGSRGVLKLAWRMMKV